jgi:hypothetical protein
MASICSVTFMDPSSLAIPEALRPATSSELKTGPGRAVLIQGTGHLQSHDGSAEKAGQDHNREAAYPDYVHLAQNVAGIMRSADDVPERPPAQENEILKNKDGRLQDIQESQ